MSIQLQKPWKSDCPLRVNYEIKKDTIEARFGYSFNKYLKTYYVLGTVLSNGGSKAYSPYAAYILVGRETTDKIK